MMLVGYGGALQSLWEQAFSRTAKVCVCARAWRFSHFFYSPTPVRAPSTHSYAHAHAHAHAHAYTHTNIRYIYVQREATHLFCAEGSALLCGEIQNDCDNRSNWVRVLL